MIKEFERVALVVDLPEFGFFAGDVGVIVDISPNGKQFTLELFNFANQDRRGYSCEASSSPPSIH